jgi:hypothetical protein
MFLDGIEWSNEGMKLGSTDQESVECVTNHLSSFAMVVLDAEVHPLVCTYNFYNIVSKI